jgi:YVTN family beta-propeller protein
MLNKLGLWASVIAILAVVIMVTSGVSALAGQTSTSPSGIYPAPIVEQPSRTPSPVGDGVGSEFQGVHGSDGVEATIALGHNMTPGAAAYDSSNGDVYVLDDSLLGSYTNSNTVSVVNGTQIIKNITVGWDPLGVVYDSANGYVYVANSQSNNVTVINGQTNSVIANISVGNRPSCEVFDRDNNLIYVANAGSNNVSVIDASMDVITGSVPVGSDPIFEAYDSVLNHVFVLNYESDNVTVIKAAYLSAAHNITVDSNPRYAVFDSYDGYLDVVGFGTHYVDVITGAWQVYSRSWPGGSPGYPAYDAQNTCVYVPVDGGQDEVGVIAGISVLGNISVGAGPDFALYNSDNQFVYVLNGESNNVTIINGTSDRVYANVPVGHYPDYAVSSSYLGAVYVENAESNNVSVIHGFSNAVIATIPVGNSPTMLAYDSGKNEVFSANQGTGNVSVVAASTNSVVANINVGSSPWGIAYDSNNGHVFVSNSGANTVSVISDVNNAVIATINDGLKPLGLAYDSANQYIYAADWGSNGQGGGVTVINGTTNTIVANITVGDDPNYAAVDSANNTIWITDWNGAKVYVISGTSNAVVTSMSTGPASFPGGIAYDPTHNRMYVANASYSYISVYDASTYGLVASIHVSAEPENIVYDSWSNMIYATTWSHSNSLEMISPTYFKVIQTVTVGQLNYGIAYDYKNCNIYVSSWATNSLEAVGGCLFSVTSIDEWGPYLPSIEASDSANGYVYVANWGSSSVSVISGNSLVTNVKVGVMPDYVVYDSQNGYVYVACLGEYEGPWNSSSVSVISGTRVISNISVGQDLDYLLYDNQNGYVYAPAAHNLTLLHGTSIVGAVTVGQGPTDPIVDTWNGYVYVPNAYSNTVSVVSNQSVKATISVGGYPSSALYDSSNKCVYVANLTDPDMTLICGTSFIGNHFYTPVSLADAVYDSVSHEIFAPGTYGEYVFNTIANQTAQIYHIFPTGQEVGHAALNSTSHDVYVPSFTTTVSLVNSTQIIGNITVGSEPYFADYDSGNGNVYVTNEWSDNVSVLNGYVPPLTISSFTASHNPTDVGVSTTLTVSASGGSSSYSYTYTGLPSGCSTSNTSALACTPTATGTYTVRVYVNDTIGNSATTTMSLTLTSQPVISSFGVVRNPIDSGFTEWFNISASGGTGTLSYAYTGLPAGCYSSNTNSLTCAPTGTGTFTVRVYVNDTVTGSATQTHSLTVNGDMGWSQFTVSRSPIDSNKVVWFNMSGVSGGTTPYSYTYKGLPAGCTSSNTSSLSCSPTGTGTFTVRVFVNDSARPHYTITTTVSLTVNANPSISSFTASPNPTDTGVSTPLSVTASGGTGGLTYKYTGLPPGCSSSNTSSLACVPTTAGTFTVRVYANDTLGSSASTTLTLTVNSAVAITGSVMATTISVGTQPEGVAYDNAKNEIFVTNYRSNYVDVISDSSFTVLTTVSVGSYPRGIVYDSAKSEIFVANIGSNYVSVISDSSNSVVAKIGVGVAPFFMAYDSNQGEVFVANENSNNVSVISDSTNRVVATIGVGTQPFSAAYDSKMGEVFVANDGSNNVSVINDGTNHVVATVPVGTAPYFVAYDSSRGEIFVPNGGSNYVSVISDSSNNVVAKIGLGTGPYGAAYASGMGEVFVANYGSGNVSAINDNTNSVAASITVGTNPFSLAYDAGTNYVFVSNRGSNTVGVITGVYSDVNPTEIGLTTFINVTASGGTGTLTYRYTGLPGGCSSSNTAALSCSPSATGTFKVRAYANDTVGGSATTILSLVVKPNPSISSFTASHNPTDVGVSTTLTVVASGGAGTFTYKYTGLPTGCSSSNTASLACTPTATGTFIVRVYANDTYGKWATATLSLTVNNKPTISSFTAAHNPVGKGKADWLNVSASGGTGTLSYAYTGLPGGCTSSNTNSLACTPTNSGTFTIRVYANDTLSQSATTTLSLTVNP